MRRTMTAMDRLEMNLEVAAGWLQYCGLSEVQTYSIDHDGSVRLHLLAGKLAERAARGMPSGERVTVDRGEVHSGSGAFLGRFIAVKMDSFWGGGLYAVAATARTDGGDIGCGAAVLQTTRQVRGLSEDIGRALTLPRAGREGAITAAMRKWEGLNPPGWKNPFRKDNGLFRTLGLRILTGVRGLARVGREVRGGWRAMLRG